MYEASTGVNAGICTICGRSRESLPMVLKTRSCNLLTTPRRSSPRDAMAILLVGGMALERDKSRARPFSHELRALK